MWTRYLEMGIPRQQDIAFLVCTFDHDAHEPFEARLHVCHLVQQPQAHVRRHLIVPRSPCVQLTPKRSDQLAQPAFIGSMDIFVIRCRRELERANVSGKLGSEGRKRGDATYLPSFPFPPDGFESLGYLGFFLARQDAYARKRLGVRDRAADISGVHTLIILKRLIERVHPDERVSASLMSPQRGEEKNTNSGSVLPVNRPPHNFCLVG